MKIKKKLRYLTEEEYRNFYDNCTQDCETCIFRKVHCDYTFEVYPGEVLDNDFCWFYNKELYSNKFLDQEIEIEVEEPKPTKEEIAFLKLLKPKWKWIARDRNGCAYIYEAKPTKHMDDDVWFEEEKKHYRVKDIFNLLELDFSFLSWEDEEPTNIQKLIEEYGNE